MNRCYMYNQNYIWDEISVCSNLLSRYKKILYECQWDNSPSKSQFVKYHYRANYGLQHRALAHTEQQDIKGPKLTSEKNPFKRENQRYNLYKKKRNDKGVDSDLLQLSL